MCARTTAGLFDSPDSAIATPLLSVESGSARAMAMPPIVTDTSSASTREMPPWRTSTRFALTVSIPPLLRLRDVDLDVLEATAGDRVSRRHEVGWGRQRGADDRLLGRLLGRRFGRGRRLRRRRRLGRVAGLAADFALSADWPRRRCRPRSCARGSPWASGSWARRVPVGSSLAGRSVMGLAYRASTGERESLPVISWAGATAGSAPTVRTSAILRAGTAGPSPGRRPP